MLEQVMGNLEQTLGYFVYLWSFLVLVLGVAVFYKKKKRRFLILVVCCVLSLLIILFRGEVVKIMLH
ncbi:hypothetical protein ACJDU8_25070 [Clostridium sp. WILCCON 0269]|uniref:LPXTG cell wall anchor domain-containing protein n=1 Tax=Candidatus Clostridium eludens TaxID=3381663 RepID=A0ABW8ST88_9CLOT